MNHFTIDDDREYSFTEFMRLVSRACSAVADAQKNIGADQEQLVFPARDVYFAIFDLVGLASSRVKGEFKLVQPKAGEYRIYYSPESEVRPKAKMDSTKDVIATALSLYKKAGIIPAMAKSNPEVMRALQAHIDKQGGNNGEEA